MKIKTYSVKKTSLYMHVAIYQNTEKMYVFADPSVLLQTALAAPSNETS